MSVLREFLFNFASWLDAEPIRYALLAWTCLSLTVLTALAPVEPIGARKPGWAKSWLFALGVVLTLIAFRWPTWFVPEELNPDESQMLAGALTLRHYPVFWKYVDGATGGPLNHFFLLFGSWFGLPLNYLGARIIAALLEAGALLCLWAALRRLTSERIARVGILPGLAFWSFASWHDDINYSSELVAVFLIAIAAWLLITALSQAELVTWRARLQAGLAGICLGAVPFAKLQAVPVAGAVGLAGLLVLWHRRKQTGAGKIYGLLLGGASGATIIVGAYLAVFGLFPQFWVSYILSNLGYVANKPNSLTDMAVRFFALITVGHYFACFLLGSVVFALLHVLLVIEQVGPRLRAALLAAWLCTGAAYLAVILPGREATHYLQLMVIPVTFLAGIHLAALVQWKAAAGRSMAVSLVVFVLLTLGPQIWRRGTGWNIYLGNFAEYRARPPLSASRFILARALPGDRLAMWGWNAQIYVETGLPQGTREANTAYQLIDMPLRSFYRDRYLRDIKRWRPAWFVDAVGPSAFGFKDRGINGFETFPELAAFIGAQYTFVSEAGDLRIFHLKP